MKTAIVILSDPQNDTGEAAARMFNGLAVAYDYHQAGDDVNILFQGPGTRWPEVLQDTDHPAHALFKSVEGRIRGVSRVCARHFEADVPDGLHFVDDNVVPNPYGLGLPSLRGLREQGYDVLVF